MKAFLNLKHWVLFVILVAPLIAIRVISVMSFIRTGSPEAMTSHYPIILISYSVLIFGWLWLMGKSLTSVLPSDMKMNLSFFTGSIILPFLYILFISFNLDKFPLNNDLWIIPLHVFSLFCILFACAFCAMTLKSIEEGRKVKFGEYIGDIMLILIFPVGIWYIQPRINKISN